MSFPTFPIFRKISLTDDRDYKAIYATVPPYSDFSFNNLFVWLDANNDLQISAYQNNIILRFSNIFEENAITYTVLGTKDCPQTVQTVLDYLRATGASPELKMVPDCVVNDIKSHSSAPTTIRPKFQVIEDVDNRDYIVEVEPTVALQGRRFLKIRRAVNGATKEYGDRISIRPLHFQNDETRDFILQKLDEWQKDTSFTPNDPKRNEILAIHRQLRLSFASPPQGFALSIDGTMRAFAIYHKPPQAGWIIFNHIKCDPTTPKLFDVMYYFMFQEFLQMGIKWVNIEQDLGIEGLRYHKQHLGPSHYLYRYTITE